MALEVRLRNLTRLLMSDGRMLASGLQVGTSGGKALTTCCGEGMAERGNRGEERRWKSVKGLVASMHMEGSFLDFIKLLR